MHATLGFTDPRAKALPRRHAVVVGGGMAGMLAAHVLADHFELVTLLERDHLPDTPAHRKGLPQARHIHALLKRGQMALERLLPGLTTDLLEAGALLLDSSGDLASLTPFGWGIRFRSDLQLLACTRDLIDWCIRRRVAARLNVRLRQEVAAVGLVAAADGQAVAAVRLRPSHGDMVGPDGEEELAADWVAVASGRDARLPNWLAALGYPTPPETVVNSFLGYATRLYHPPRGYQAEWKGLTIYAAPPNDPRGGAVIPVEGGRWLVMLTGGDGDYPPTDEAGFLDRARTMRAPDLYEAIRDAEPIGPIVGYRATENRLRHYERAGRWPEGLVALGDAVCALNPVYGQGMTTAALGAEVLDRCLRRSRAPQDIRPGTSLKFQRELGRMIAVPWLLATGSDYRYRRTEGPPRRRSARMMHRYVDALTRLSTRNVSVRRRLLEVFHLLRPPVALFGPGVLGPMAWAWLTGGAAE
jgi:2-polyprenyl-6-methoxyphenol hydroxylase-like FAD-dependent oxidoreductase